MHNSRLPNRQNAVIIALCLSVAACGVEDSPIEPSTTGPALARSAVAAYTFVDLGTLPGGCCQSLASDINARGQVVGSSTAIVRPEDGEDAEDHPFLWPYIQPQAELYINGSPVAPDRILRRMFQAYEETIGMNPWQCEQWPPVPTGLRNIRNCEKFFADGYGLLAKGPESLVRAYVQVLKEEGLDHQVLERGLGWRLEGRKHLPAPALLHLQPDWVVAREFRAARVA